MTLPAVEFHPAAVEEARAAREWYAQRSVPAAHAFVAELDAAIDCIVKSPEMCPGYLYGTQRYLLRRFPYIVVFRRVQNSIQVIAVAHGRRRPGYWKDREPEP